MKDASGKQKKQPVKLQPPTSSAHSIVKSRSVDVVLDYGRHYYDSRVEEARELDNKAASLLSTAGSVAALATLGFTFICDKEVVVGGGTRLFSSMCYSFVVALMCFLASAWLAIAAYQATRMEDVTNPIEVLSHYVQDYRIGDETRLKEIIAFKYADAALNYVKVIDGKVKRVLWSQRLLVVGLVSLGLFMVFLTWGVGGARYSGLLGEQTTTGSQVSNSYMKGDETNGRQTSTIPTEPPPGPVFAEADKSILGRKITQGERQDAP